VATNPARLDPHFSPGNAPSLVFFAPVGTCSLHPSLDATLWVAGAVQIGCPADLSLNQMNNSAFGRERPPAQKIRRDLHITW